MKKLFRKLILFSTLVLFFQCQNEDPVNNSHNILKIMYLGDSITQGALGGDCTYTTHLTDMLQKRNICFELVGSVSQWGIQHEGHYGWRTDSVLQHINKWTNGKNLDIVLCHLGTNDLEHEHDLEIDSVIDRTIGELEAIIDTIRSGNPNVSFFIAQIIPHKYSTSSSNFQKFNKKIADIKQRKSVQNSPVYIVDQFVGFSTVNDLGDDVHPNKSGAIKMTQKWLSVLDSCGILNMN